MHILHICNDYYYSTIYRNMHYHLISQSIDSIMLVPLGLNEVDRPKEEKVIQAKCFNKIDRFFYFIKQRKIINTIKRKVEKFRPNVLHAHFVFSSGYACMKIKQGYNIPYIVAVRNTDVNLFFKRMIHLRKVGIQVILNADKVVFISPSYRDLVIYKYIPLKYRESIVEKSVVLPNGIDDFWLTNTLVKNKKVEDQKIHLITVGAINQNKNQITVVKAVELLIRKGYQTTYTVVGKIEDENIYNELVKYDFVNYVESQPKEKLIDYYREADIFVMPSITETFGLVYAEAMSQGLPVIYSKGQGFDGQFQEGEVGYGVDCFDIRGIVDQICITLKDYSELSNRCVINCDAFNWNTITKEYIDIYSDIIEN